MIPKNLKVGETFTDGGYTYKVLEIVKDGYISTKITNANVKKYEPKVEEEVEEISVPETITNANVNYNKTQINRLPNSKLEEVCKELGIEIGTGTEMKRAIIAKLGL